MAGGPLSRWPVAVLLDCWVSGMLHEAQAPLSAAAAWGLDGTVLGALPPAPLYG